MARFEPGDYVHPTDFRRRVLCRVVAAESIADGAAQILWLEPLEGPWPPGTHLVRLDDAVRVEPIGKVAPSP